ncbi:nucleoside-diphosphate sugar epimerase/dehydratase [Cognatishimia sp. WU-CL00825]|uniref:polysaccharide biosynthesis protein n=1 Tax=Cognatishimia sp. WU-CL00825 TaxID=3127658 RepID=UPI00336574A4
MMILAFWVAQLLTLSPPFSAQILLQNSVYLVLILPFGAAIIRFFGLHRVKLNSYALQGVSETATVASVVGICGLICNMLPGFSRDLPVATLVVYALTFFAFCVGARIVLREMVMQAYSSVRTRKKVLIYGAGQTGQQLAAALMTDDEFIAFAFIDDNTALRKLTISGLRVYAPNSIETLVRREKIDRVVVAMPSATQFKLNRIRRRLKNLECEVLAVPSFAEMVVKGKNIAPDLRPVKLSSLLGRDKFEADMPQQAQAYKGRRILVTGAGGSIGSELCRQILTCPPSCLVLIDHSELALYQIQAELEDLANGVPVIAILGSVTDVPLVKETLETYDIDVVLHAAAYKHVPLVEQNCLQGLQNNVLGTKIVAEAARVAGVERFILISSDKAVRPTSFMGASKRLAEMVIQDLATRSTTTRFAMVRFGNVLGSSGSVIPLFEKQIRRGGPLTVTHSDVTRYFMTIPEAVRLVLLAGAYSRGGDVFVLDMGKPVLIYDVARQMIEGAGFKVRDEATPDGDIEIEFIGMRPGEKMHEELLIGKDMLTTPHPKILRAQEFHPSEIEVANILQELRKAIELRNEEQALQVIHKWVEANFENQDSANLVNQ